MKNVTLKAGNEQDFFRRGKVLARLADAGRPMPKERTVSFEDPADMLRLLTASRLQRDRSAVKRDVDQFAQVGLVTIDRQRSQPIEKDLHFNAKTSNNLIAYSIPTDDCIVWFRPTSSICCRRRSWWIQTSGRGRQRPFVRVRPRQLLHQWEI